MRTIIVTDTWSRAQIVAEEIGVRKGKIWWVYDAPQIAGISLNTPVVIDVHRATAMAKWKELKYRLTLFKDVTNYTSPRPKRP
jgi:hypothetical protein